MRQEISEFLGYIGTERGFSPKTVTLPAVGRSCPVTSFSSVDFPAPFGPSSAVIPGAIVVVTSLRPITCPYHRLACSRVIIRVSWTKPEPVFLYPC